MHRGKKSGLSLRNWILHIKKESFGYNFFFKKNCVFHKISYLKKLTSLLFFIKKWGFWVTNNLKSFFCQKFKKTGIFVWQRKLSLSEDWVVKGHFKSHTLSYLWIGECPWESSAFFSIPDRLETPTGFLRAKPQKVQACFRQWRSERVVWVDNVQWSQS